MNIGALGVARAASAGLATLGESLKDAVVEVRGDRGSSGTAIIWGGAGLLVTAAHCVPRGALVQVETNGAWRDADERIRRPRRTADHRLEQDRVVAGAERGVRADGRVAIGEELAIDRDQIPLRRSGGKLRAAGGERLPGHRRQGVIPERELVELPGAPRICQRF